MRICIDTWIECCYILIEVISLKCKQAGAESRDKKGAPCSNAQVRDLRRRQWQHEITRCGDSAAPNELVQLVLGKAFYVNHWCYNVVLECRRGNNVQCTLHGGASGK